MAHPFTLYMASIPMAVAEQRPMMSIYDGALLEEASRHEVFTRIETDDTILVVGWKTRVATYLSHVGVVAEVVEFVPPDYMA